MAFSLSVTKANVPLEFVPLALDHARDDRGIAQELPRAEG
jgi:hypothetical protein